VHPYTLAAPGGWAWTDLSGGFLTQTTRRAQCWRSTIFAPQSAAARQAAIAGIEWLLNVQNSDGGIYLLPGWASSRSIAAARI